MRRYLKSLVLTSLFVFGFAPSGLALTDEALYSQFQFNFITPGARATALGGAFIGLADDATAVESNPAGLTLLYKPEISIEFKQIDYTTTFPYTSSNRRVIRKDFDDTVESIPFVSLVYPFQGQRKFVFALYRQESVNYKSSFKTGANWIDTGAQRDQWINPYEAALDIMVTNYGVGFAVELLEDHLSLAVSPRWSLLNMNSHFARFNSNPTDFSDNDVWWETKIDDQDSGFGINVGLKWVLEPRLSFGAVYRSGTKFIVNFSPGRGVGKFADPKDANYNGDWTEFTFNLPDTFGAGVAFRAIENDQRSLLFTFDVVHIRYSKLMEDFDDLWGWFKREEFTLENATEIHAGAEYEIKFVQGFFRSLFLRVGGYTDPKHRIRYTGNNLNRKEEVAGDDEEIHFTGGVGVAFNEHLQIDAAVNLANKVKQVSLSAVYHF